MDSNTIVFDMIPTITFKLSSKLYVRDPHTSDLGHRIIQSSVDLIDRVGNEDFTFKKLATAIQSTEASIYRYFENKHKLLLYLIDWYWTWVEFRIGMSLQNIHSPEEKLRIALRALVEEKDVDPEIPYVNEKKLQRIVISEFEKTYLTKDVDSDNKDGLFFPYKSLCKAVASIITELNPKYKYPHSLVSTVLLSINHQLYYASHLPSLSDINAKSRDRHEELCLFLEELVLNTVGDKR